MKIVLSGLAGIGGLALAALTASAMTAHATADIRDYSFHKPAIKIAAGTAVTWTNRDDDPHTVTADDKSFDSKGLGNGDAWSHTFTKPGTYRYHCAVHPFMKGTIIVTETANHR